MKYIFALMFINLSLFGMQDDGISFEIAPVGTKVFKRHEGWQRYEIANKSKDGILIAIRASNSGSTAIFHENLERNNKVVLELDSAINTHPLFLTFRGQTLKKRSFKKRLVKNRFCYNGNSRRLRMALSLLASLKNTEQLKKSALKKRLFCADF